MLTTESQSTDSSSTDDLPDSTDDSTDNSSDDYSSTTSFHAPPLHRHSPQRCFSSLAPPPTDSHCVRPHRSVLGSSYVQGPSQYKPVAAVPESLTVPTYRIFSKALPKSHFCSFIADIPIYAPLTPEPEFELYGQAKEWTISNVGAGIDAAAYACGDQICAGGKGQNFSLERARDDTGAFFIGVLSSFRLSTYSLVQKVKALDEDLVWTIGHSPDSELDANIHLEKKDERKGGVASQLWYWVPVQQ
ncbi:hypothetical protein K438DRAFT_1991910 [Mycena galopus ATCC 62051]|nr:hypothetical protein K438DRAFT_1991910 [Mycena galopus ATCC 62051]